MANENGKRILFGDFADIFKVSDIEGLQAQLDDKAAIAHGHTVPEVANLEIILGAKAEANHTHEIGNVSGLQAVLDTIGDFAALQAQVNDKAPLVHGHTVGEIDSLETALTFKAAVIHTHVVEDVSGLQAALDAKADQTDLDAKPETFFELYDVEILDPLAHIGEFLTIGPAGEIVSSTGGEASSLSDGQELQVKK